MFWIDARRLSNRLSYRCNDDDVECDTDTITRWPEMKVWYTRAWPQTAPPTQTQGSQVIVNRPTPLEDHQTERERESPRSQYWLSDTSFSAEIQHILNPSPTQCQDWPLSRSDVPGVSGYSHFRHWSVSRCLLWVSSVTFGVYCNNEWLRPAPKQSQADTGPPTQSFIVIRTIFTAVKIQLRSAIVDKLANNFILKIPINSSRNNTDMDTRSCVYSQWWEYFLLRNKVWQIQRVHDC